MTKFKKKNKPKIGYFLLFTKATNTVHSVSYSYNAQIQLSQHVLLNLIQFYLKYCI